MPQGLLLARKDFNPTQKLALAHLFCVVGGKALRGKNEPCTQRPPRRGREVRPPAALPAGWLRLGVQTPTPVGLTDPPQGSTAVHGRGPGWGSPGRPLGVPRAALATPTFSTQPHCPPVCRWGLACILEAPVWQALPSPRVPTYPLSSDSPVRQADMVARPDSLGHSQPSRQALRPGHGQSCWFYFKRPLLVLLICSGFLLHRSAATPIRVETRCLRPSLLKQAFEAKVVLCAGLIACSFF